MLSNTHFYHRITRKVVVAFGTLFNNIRLVRYNQTNTKEIERINVPLSYMPKEKFFQRISQDPNLLRETGINLPRMVFELNSITYDPLRKTSMFNQQFSPNPTSGSTASSVRSAPYNFDFTLSIYVRNTEDGTQIIEQILPYFSPDYTVSVALTSLPDVKTDIPIVLNSIQYSTPDAVGSPNDIRILNWDLTFTAKATLYGPINSNRALVKDTSIKGSNYSSGGAGSKLLTLTGGNSINYKIGELVYEGNTIDSATGSGFVQSWDPISGTLLITDVNGVVSTGKVLRGAVSGAAWTLDSYRTSDYPMFEVTAVPNPPTANSTDDFGFTITINEFV